jgi:hypothetical protein
MGHCGQGEAIRFLDRQALSGLPRRCASRSDDLFRVSQAGNCCHKPGKSFAQRRKILQSLAAPTQVFQQHTDLNQFYYCGTEYALFLAYAGEPHGKPNPEQS